MNTRIHILSDLHLEFGKGQFDYEAPECDVVVLAGDIGIGISAIEWITKTFKVPVLYIPGNHEFYGLRIFRQIEKLRAATEGTNITLLDNNAVTIGDIQFLGSTLWTDFGLYGDPSLAMFAAQTGMTDFRVIERSQQVPFTATTSRVIHQASMQWLAEQDFSKKTVVITHHAPSEQSVAARWKGDSMTPAFASNLEPFILDKQPALWIHGHMHNSSDYMIDKTRVVCNPRGYFGYELNPDFNPKLVIDI